MTKTLFITLWSLLIACFYAGSLLHFSALWAARLAHVLR